MKVLQTFSIYKTTMYEQRFGLNDVINSLLLIYNVKKFILNFAL